MADGSPCSSAPPQLTPKRKGATPRLERLDFHFTKFDQALVALDALVVLEPQAVLQRDPPRGEFGVLRPIDGLLSVERHGECRALRGDLIDVPLAGGLRHRIDLADIDDGAGAVGRIGTGIPDVHLIGRGAADLVGIGAANENAAIGFAVDPEFSPDLVIGIALLRDQEAVAPVGDDGAVLDPPIGVPDLVEIVEGLAVEQRYPAAIGLRGGPLYGCESGKAGQSQGNADG